LKLSLVTVGRLKDRHVAPLCADYSGRITRYAPWSIVEVKDARGESSKRAPSVEADRLLDRIPKQAHVVTLDEHGARRTSVDFSRWLDARQHAGKDVVFVLGGPFGLGDAVKQRANESLRLSDMTLPHELARLLFLEQLYRAFTILRGSKYHHV